MLVKLEDRRQESTRDSWNRQIGQSFVVALDEAFFVTFASAGPKANTLKFLVRTMHPINIWRRGTVDALATVLNRDLAVVILQFSRKFQTYTA